MKNAKKMKKVAVCSHLCLFRVSIYTRRKNWNLESRSHCALFITTFFFTFQKEERERERLIFVERTTLNKSTRRAHAQNNETGNT